MNPSGGGIPGMGGMCGGERERVVSSFTLRLNLHTRCDYVSAESSQLFRLVCGSKASHTQ